MGRYQRMSLIEREELSRMLATGASLRAIGQALSRAPSTVSRELTRHHASPVTYRAVPGPPTGTALGTPAAQATEARDLASLAHRGLWAARTTLVPGTDCARVAATVS